MHSILSAVSHLPQLTGTLRHAAQRLAYFADSTGTLQRSYAALANDRHVHISTAKRLIARLIDAKIIEKTVVRLSRTRCARNVYRFTSQVMTLVHKRASSKSRQPNNKGENSSRAREEHLVRQRWALHNLSLTAEARESLQEEIARLEGLLRC
jgi:hypothetical protein